MESICHWHRNDCGGGCAERARARDDAGSAGVVRRGRDGVPTCHAGVQSEDGRNRGGGHRTDVRYGMHCELPDFDYATYVRERIKKKWVGRDNHTLYVFLAPIHVCRLLASRTSASEVPLEAAETILRWSFRPCACCDTPGPRPPRAVSPLQPGLY